MESPEYVRVSTAADMILGFTPGKFYRHAQPYCINLLLHFTDGCKANCLYCGQAREIARSSMCKTLIRVDWPLRRLSDVVERIKRFNWSGCSLRPYRVCVATITNRKAVEAEIEVVRAASSTGMPVSALITPTLFREEEMGRLKDAGAERIGIAIDCATKEVFELLRGRKARGPHRWERYLQGVEEAVKVMGKGRVGVHLIVGLGETERDAVNLMQYVHDLGAETHLFSFYPEEGSVLEGWPRPPIGQYRRVQLARYLIDTEQSYAENMRFSSAGQIIDFGVPRWILEEVVESGYPFITSGCPGCNRPYANERPGEIIRNYPFKPSEEEVRDICRQLWTYAYPYNTLEHLVEYLSGRLS